MAIAKNGMMTLVKRAVAGALWQVAAPTVSKRRGPGDSIHLPPRGESNEPSALLASRAVAKL
jgi:hypothetical protein